MWSGKTYIVVFLLNSLIQPSLNQRQSEPCLEREESCGYSGKGVASAVIITSLPLFLVITLAANLLRNTHDEVDEEIFMDPSLLESIKETETVSTPPPKQTKLSKKYKAFTSTPPPARLTKKRFQRKTPVGHKSNFKRHQPRFMWEASLTSVNEATNEVSLHEVDSAESNLLFMSATSLPSLSERAVGRNDVHAKPPMRFVSATSLPSLNEATVDDGTRQEVGQVEPPLKFMSATSLPSLNETTAYVTRQEVDIAEPIPTQKYTDINFTHHFDDGALYRQRQDVSSATDSTTQDAIQDMQGSRGCCGVVFTL